jgi:hypothetical protein
MATIVDMARDATEAVPISCEDAAALSRFYAAYALDRYWDEGDRPTDRRRRFHPGVGTHLTAARAQLDAAVKLSDPSYDQIVGVAG